MTAKQLHDNIAGTPQETATAPYLTALENFLQVRFDSTADRYIDTFSSTLQSVSSDDFSKENPWNLNDHSIGTGFASAPFVIGTKTCGLVGHVAGTWVYSPENKLAPLKTIISSLRSIAGNRAQPVNAAHAATGHTQRNIDPETYYTENQLLENMFQQLSNYQFHSLSNFGLEA
ncbi:hypothetical protein K3495_g4828 [Podosphaera aphanis]|nr:hypothetical protein K3495_g4828 [Podosphaera aphanis]